MERIYYYDIDLFKEKKLSIARIDDVLDVNFLRENKNLRVYKGNTIAKYPYYDQKLNIIRECVNDKEKIDVGYINIPEDMILNDYGDLIYISDIPTPNNIFNYIMDKEKNEWIIDNDLYALRKKMSDNILDLYREYKLKTEINEQYNYNIYNQHMLDDMLLDIDAYKTIICDIDDELKQ